MVLHLLRAIRGDLSELRADMIEVKERLGAIENGYSSVSRRVDRLGGDMLRIEERLNLVEAD